MCWSWNGLSTCLSLVARPSTASPDRPDTTRPQACAFTVLPSSLLCSPFPTFHLDFFLYSLFCPTFLICKYLFHTQIKSQCCLKKRQAINGMLFPPFFSVCACM